jgi:hypothetical protein
MPDAAPFIGDRDQGKIGSDEWGGVVTRTPTPPNSAVGMSVRAAREAITFYETFRANNPMPPHDEDQVFIIRGPEVDEKLDGEPVGWYAHLPSEPDWWPPRPGDVITAPKLSEWPLVRTRRSWDRAADIAVTHEARSGRVELLVRDGTPWDGDD